MININGVQPNNTNLNTGLGLPTPEDYARFELDKMQGIPTSERISKNGLKYGGYLNNYKCGGKLRK